MSPDAAALQPLGKAIFSLYTLGCSSCSFQLERKLKKMPGITEVNVNYVADMVEVQFNPSQIRIDEIRAYLKKLGYDAGTGRWSSSTFSK